MTDVKVDTFLEVVAGFDDGECYWCARDEGCHCNDTALIDSSLRPNGTKGPNCKCTCGTCYAPWGEVLDD